MTSIVELLSGSVGNGHRNDPGDIFAMKTNLQNLGYYDQPIQNGYIDQPMVS